jgi:exoribonuclease-2
MKELGLSETPEDAHSLLLKTDFWTKFINPHPSRFGLSLNSANICPDPPRQEQRRDLCHLAAFAIDSPWSYDPDDAISIEESDSGSSLLYVHVADVSASITFNSPAENEARDRGTTLYLPEGTVRMLAEEALPMFALGLSEKSIALTFKVTIDKDGYVVDTEIFPSIVKVKRITYEQADREINNANTEDAKVLNALNDLSIRINKRRILHGAIEIDLPDVHISVKNEKVNIEPVIQYKSASMVKECMVAAGESAGIWAFERGLTFPYISQEVEIQGDIQDGLAGLSLAGSWQLRRCMRPRIQSTKPGYHQGLGLDTYTQVTSPLRRYTDLLAHLQIRAFLRGETPLNADEVSARLGFSEAAAIAAVQAERASNNHWLMVYLSGKKDSVWDAIALENKGNRMLVIIPSLAIETLVSLQKNILPNESVKLTLKSVNIPRGEAVFI